MKGRRSGLPLGGMRLTTGAFPAMTMAVRVIAEECCLGRMVVVTEGGYDLMALRASIDGVVEALRGPVVPMAWPSSHAASKRGRDAVSAVHQSLASFWSFPAAPLR